MNTQINDTETSIKFSCNGTLIGYNDNNCKNNVTFVIPTNFVDIQVNCNYGITQCPYVFMKQYYNDECEGDDNGDFIEQSFLINSCINVAVFSDGDNFLINCTENGDNAVAYIYDDTGLIFLYIQNNPCTFIIYVYIY